MYSFPNLEQVHCSMSSSNYCFLTWIQISQEMAKEVWYSHLFQNFPQFVVIHTVKGFGIVNKAEVDVFLELSCFFYIKVGECYFCLSHLLRCTTIFHNQADSNTCYFFTVRTTKSSIVHSNFNHIEMSSDPVLYWMTSSSLWFHFWEFSVLGINSSAEKSFKLFFFLLLITGIIFWLCYI